MPTPSHRNLKPHQRRAIVLLAGCGAEGCTEAVMLVHGFTTDQLAGLVRTGLVAKTTERVVSSGQTSRHRALPGPLRVMCNGGRLLVARRI
jgi:hypothetical protein